MRRVVRLFGVMLVCGALQVQASEPLVEVTFEETSTVPGQPLSLRVTVLVPTWLPKPVVFPSLEAPNILVRTPEGSTGPTSRTIEGETWSGVTRRYSITPMVPGRFDIAGQELVITWAEPGQTDPLEARVALDPVVIEGVVPEGAEDLDPFIAAQSLSLSRDVSDVQMPLQPGDSVTLTVTAQIEGVSGMFLPPLMPPFVIDGVAVYPAEPRVADTENRGDISGSRTESLTLLAEGGGRGQVPPVSLRWYNLTTKEVETATLDALDLEVDGPVLSGDRSDPRAVVLGAIAAALLGALGWVLYRWLAPKLRRYLADRQARLHASERWAYAQVTAAVDAEDIAALMQRLEIWAMRCAEDPRGVDPLYSALSALGSARYGQHESPQSDAWRGVKSALQPTRTKVQYPSRHRPDLPPLNPTTPTV